MARRIVVTVPVFDLRDVTYRYHEVTALDGLNLTIMPGQRIALLGANGSGKSTLLSILDGLYFPEKGSVTFQRRAFDRRAGCRSEKSNSPSGAGWRWCFRIPTSSYSIPPCLTKSLSGRCSCAGPGNKFVLRVTEMLEQMEIAHLKDRSPHHLSTGEKKRVALASVLILDPEVLLLDEPTAALDPKEREPDDRLSGELQRRPEDGGHRHPRSRPGRGYRGLLPRLPARTHRCERARRRRS